MNIYLISGLGADKRIFSRLNFEGDYQITYIAWIAPHAEETLPNYTKRLAQQIDNTVPFVLIGVSFGEIVAVEMSKFMQPVDTIIISSVPLSQYIPWYYKLAGTSNLHQVIPGRCLTTANALSYWLFGVSTTAEKMLLSQIFEETDVTFLRWAISKISAWNQEVKLKSLYQIHGTADRILPLSDMKVDYCLQSGGHLMVYTHSNIVSTILNERIATKVAESQL